MEGVWVREGLGQDSPRQPGPRSGGTVQQEAQAPLGNARQDVFGKGKGSQASRLRATVDEYLQPVHRWRYLVGL